MLSVSNYHYIRENFNSKYPSIFGVTPIEFRNQIELILNEGDIISINDVISNKDVVINSKENYFLISFDDGLNEQYNFGLSILDEFNMPGVFYLNSSNFENERVSTVHKIHLLRSIIKPIEFFKHVKNNDSIEFTANDKKLALRSYRFDTNEVAILKYYINFKLGLNKREKLIQSIFDNYFDEIEVFNKLYMTYFNILELGRRSFLGSHSHNHYALGLLNKESIRHELEHSKSYLERISHAKIESIAYPFGNNQACTKEVASIASDVGYRIGLTTIKGINTNSNSNSLLLKRFNCNDMPGGKNFKQNNL